MVGLFSCYGSSGVHSHNSAIERKTLMSQAPDNCEYLFKFILSDMPGGNMKPSWIQSQRFEHGPSILRIFHAQGLFYFVSRSTTISRCLSLSLEHGELQQQTITLSVVHTLQRPSNMY